jgi:hypothetical protein
MAKLKGATPVREPRPPCYRRGLFPEYLGTQGNAVKKLVPSIHLIDSHLEDSAGTGPIARRQRLGGLPSFY